MRLFVPEEKISRTPLWWNSERYDYCDMIRGKDSEGNMFNRFLKKISQLFT